MTENEILEEKEPKDEVEEEVKDDVEDDVEDNVQSTEIEQLRGLIDEILTRVEQLETKNIAENPLYETIESDKEEITDVTLDEIEEYLDI